MNNVHQQKGLRDSVTEDANYNNQCMLEDLQLAAELGKTLLERNKDLENTLKHHQGIIEDNNQEIEYLTKQTIALKEVNDSRLRIYEQLEVNIQDLERANHRLAVENSVDKKLIKNLTSNVETLESRCEELQAGIEDLRTQVDVLRRRTHAGNSNNSGVGKSSVGRWENSSSRLKDEEDAKRDERDGTKEVCGCNGLAVQNDMTYSCCNRPTSPLHRLADKSQETQTSPNREDPHACDVDNALEQIEMLMTQLRDSKDLYSQDQHRIMELEEQLTALHDQNRLVEKQLDALNNSKDVCGGKTMHEEFTTLEEVRQGQLCERCLRTVENGNGDCDLSSLCDAGLEDDDHSMIDALTSATSAAASGITPNQHRHRTSFTIEVQEYAKNSPPQVNLYKELVEKYEALLELHRSAIPISRQEDLQTSGEFSANTSTNLNMKDTDDESGQGDSLQPEKQSTKQTSHTPTDFSEAETSSSGFADETSNKGTQTSLTDQDDHATKIYDSRFKTNPEYKELFRDIFNTLKKDSEQPEPHVKHVPQQQDIINNDNMTDDSRSVLSCCTMSDDVSVGQMEPITVIESTAKLPERVLTPYIRQPLEYISVAVNARKRSSSRRNKKQQERSDSPMTHIVGSPKITYGSRPNSGQKRRQNNAKTVENAENANAWNGNSLQFFNRNAPSPTPSQSSCKSRTEIEFKPSQASHDLHALKKLDKSYAEVLKNANVKAMKERQRRPKYT